MNQIGLAPAGPGGFGQFFDTGTGARWIWHGVTDFSLHCRVIGGEDIRPIIRERKAVAQGADVVHRILGLMYHIRINNGWPPHHPRAYAKHVYYDTLARTFDILEAEGSRGVFCCLADCEQLGINVSEQQEIVGRSVDVLRGRPNAFFSLGNEYRKNGWSPWNFTKPAGVIASRGSNLGDEEPPRPTWDYVEPHLQRRWPQMMKDAVGVDIVVTNQSEGKPIVQDEPIGAGDADIPGRRSSDPNVFFNLGVLFALNAGGAFHSDCGIISTPWTETQRACAESFFRGLRAGTR